MGRECPGKRCSGGGISGCRGFCGGQRCLSGAFGVGCGAAFAAAVAAVRLAFSGRSSNS